MTKAMIVFAVLACIILQGRMELSQNDEAKLDAQKTIPQYLNSYGYTFEEHKAITADGYILTLWRIPKKISEKRVSKPPVLLQHGVLDNGFSWLYKIINRNLATIMADLGYDVWIGNNRGTIQSLEHVDIKSFNWKGMSSAYWDFSFDEMGKYDFPAMVDYILDTTGYAKLSYIGHSQGTVQFFVKSILDPNYINEKIQSFIGLSPVLYVHNVPGLFEQILCWLPFIDILYSINFKNFWTYPMLLPLNTWILKTFPRIMPTIVQMIAGWTKNQTLDLDRMEMIGTNEPGGTSTQNLLHWLQLMRKGGFRMMDFGAEKNRKIYGSETPPDYNVKKLSELKIPIFLMAGKADNIIGWNDLAALLKLLPKGYHFEEIADYGHLDYIWADDANIKIYPQMIQFVKQHLMK